MPTGVRGQRLADPGILPVRPSVRVSRFFKRRLRHGKGRWAGQPFTLEDWQLHDCIEPVFDTLRPNGLRLINEALWGVSKKNGKTHLAAGIGAYMLFADGRYVRDPNGWLWMPEYGGEVYNVAGSKDQAKVLFELALGFVNRDPLLRSMARPYKDAIEYPETESVWRVLSADAKLAHGPNPSAAIIDEIWVHKDPELYEAFASAQAAREQPLLLTITTAGWDQDSIAWKLYQRGKRGRNLRFHFRWWQAPDGCRLEDRKAWRAANPSRWVTPTYMRSELQRAISLGLESQFRRLHLNQWTSAKEQAIPLALWDSCKARPRIPEQAEVVIGVDSAPKRDSTGIAIDYRDDAGVHNARVTKMEADPDTGYLDFDLLEDTLRELDRTYDVQRILVDRYNMIRSMLMLAEEGLPIEEFPQSDVRMVPASMNLYELLIQKRLRHGGNPDLRKEVQAAAKRITERGWRLNKRTSSGQIDGLVALAMATYEAERGAEETATPDIFV